MARKKTANGTFSNPVYETPAPAIDVLAEATGLSAGAARSALVALVEAGYAVAPRLPTNNMLLAYLKSYGQPTTNAATTITAIGKARRRWAAMAAEGTKVALSTRRVRQPASTAAPPAVHHQQERHDAGTPAA